jgi:hypothetical protein
VVTALIPHETRAHFRAARRDSSPVTVLTPHEVRAHFRAARRDGIPLIPQCDACDERGIALLAAAYRHWRIDKGYPDPGNLCALCAARNERMIDFEVWCRRLPDGII